MKEYLVTFKNGKEIIIFGSFFLFDETKSNNNISGENNFLNAKEVLCVTEVLSSNSDEAVMDDPMVVESGLQSTKGNEMNDPEARQKKLWPHLNNLLKE
ncbi:hypothetical protein [Chengkuizengella sediminis]|uniref:hypothetical protein n=1 Tax=Chengkuizengella sediminis TaxID=1885917 RepID=UPI00138A3EC4|nr:hypothetical protein [Chengkuizengella sediminis]NDI35678.1 hypothetical protein [Chengkuizengella sediminis]